MYVHISEVSLIVYSLHGVGRATFEGTLKATFADYFPYEKEGAFANIILQNGLSGAIGYMCKLKPTTTRLSLHHCLSDVLTAIPLNATFIFFYSDL